MFSSLIRKKIPIGLLSAAEASTQRNTNPFISTTKRLIMLTPFYFGAYSHNQIFMKSLPEVQTFHSNSFKQQLLRTYRLFQLILIFLPSILLSPLTIFSLTRKYWIKVFVKGIQRAGAVWIKLFQYLSHRRDVLGENMAQGFAPLRQFAPYHSLKQTETIFKRLYGVKIQTFFEDFNPIPIASGSISQVYQGKLRGQKVAIKVRHPNIEKNIERDINIIFSVSHFLTFFSRKFQIPVNQHSLKQMLTEQIKFKKQSQNLITFNKIFKNPDVTFPKPFIETTDQVLIMTFIPGKPISYYQTHEHTMNKFIARVGASAFFQMLIQHNFIHADCHGGNIYVQIREKQKGFVSYLQYYYRLIKDLLWNKSIRFMLDSDILRRLCEQHNTEDLELKKQMMLTGLTVKVTLLDVGMVIKLEQKKRNDFINFLSEVIQGNPQECARMIHRISKYAGKLLQDDQFPQYFTDLQNMFTLVRKVSLQKLQGVDVLSGMLTVIRSHRMKIDGQFATLLTNMLTLQAIAKDLDPNINILRCAVPYLPYK